MAKIIMKEKFEQLDIFTGEKSKEYPKNPGEIKRKREKKTKDLWVKTHIEEAKRRIEKAGKKT
ncbi:MAG: hypothetical protein A3G49_03045 [Candidatus Sungbacteria bacterium RIFCSPLOWO2_12_FULL_41_11]|uniref:Uncharacterized protein n=1 Tax=Candidatus Sungbacteria bacterium RIFCSPLOWO2_12_FULL_41_11 TaxID=1802286 RepID=A0A1G2LTL4_9BACT|nr:MAG: hypothetical protein UV01_C0001G0112 [Parcubacteria group bacterium GW2011_GWA2_42_14]OGZ98859.1 MAG: hypothetical protein A3D41_02365 [Candidatus Sungbacteria bacterium RIFCSPHIGHO2_02_FULL_41_12b]OHA14192.1 MAG: hypothetical protein A3G49_03045 [Candidatus Sungbacteria bacterium RIFCSPLOWO2_12_FULL_41_11]